MCCFLIKGKETEKEQKRSLESTKGKPITVLGLEWNGLLVAGMQGVAEVAAMEYWSRKGEHATTQRDVEKSLLRKACTFFGKDVVHIFDRGYAGAPWLEELSMQKVPFVIRWKGKYNCIDEKGEEKAVWKIARGKRSWGQREIEIVQGKKTVKRSVVAIPIQHAAYVGPLWLVVGRGEKDPWYLLTNLRVETEEQAWEVILMYARRWKIEEMFRFKKSEMGVESVCLRSWDAREKLLSLVTLAYSYLLSLCDPALKESKDRLLRYGCHR